MRLNISSGVRKRLNPSTNSIVQNYVPVLITAVLTSTFILKCYYALSRPLFISGPDSNGYIPGAIDFANKKFWSGVIAFQPFEPAGYPYFLSFTVRVSRSHWFSIAQVLQIALFSTGAFFLYKILSRLFTQSIALISFLFFATNPAWFVANGEAMYETLFIFLLLLFGYTLTSHIYKPQDYQLHHFILMGLSAGFACVVHPRGIPLTLFLGLFVVMRPQFPKIGRFVVAICYVTPILIFSVRNFLVYKEFTLSNALWNSFIYNNFFSGCRGFGCLLNRTANDPIGLLQQLFINTLYFFSPNTGILQRGTWHHNISAVFFLEIHGQQTASNILAIVISSVSFSFWIVGFLMLLRNLKGFPKLWILSTFIIILTDAFVYGENRHRLIAQIFMLPAQIYLIEILWHRISKMFNSSRNSWFETST